MPKAGYPQEGTTKFYNYRKYGALFVTTLTINRGYQGAVFENTFLRTGSDYITAALCFLL
jgi:hypothetical protein